MATIFCWLLIAICFYFIVNDHVQWKRYMDSEKKWLEKFKLSQEEQKKRFEEKLEEINKDKE